MPVFVSNKQTEMNENDESYSVSNQIHLIQPKSNNDLLIIKNILNNSNDDQVLFIKNIFNELTNNEVNSSNELINGKHQQVDIFIKKSNELINEKIHFIDNINGIIQDEITKRLNDINPHEKIKNIIIEQMKTYINEINELKSSNE